MLDAGKKIPISINDIIYLTPQDSDSYFILEGNLDGAITFDITNLNNISNFNFNVLCDNITAVKTLQFKFLHNGIELTDVGHYERLEDTEFEVEPTRIYCFACSIILEGMFNSVPRYSAAVNLAYVTNKMPLKYIQPCKTGNNIGDVNPDYDYSFDFSITEVKNEESSVFEEKIYPYGPIRHPMWKSFTNKDEGLTIGENGGYYPAGRSYILEFEKELKINSFNYQMTIGWGNGNGIFIIFGFDEEHEEWIQLAQFNSRKEFPQYIHLISEPQQTRVSVDLKFETSLFFKKYKLTFDKYSTSTVYYKDTHELAEKESSICTMIVDLIINGEYNP